MNRPPFQSMLTQMLANFFRASKLTPWQIALASLGIIAMLYTGLIISLSRPTAVAQATQPAIVAPQMATSTATPLPAQNVSDDDLSDTFLSEYARLAGEPTAETTPAQPSTPVNNGSWAGTLTFSLLIVSGLAYAGIWGFKQFTLRAGKSTLGFGNKQLSIQETQILGPHQKLHLIRLGQEMLLIGATDHTITCLARYDAELLTESFDEHLQAALTPQSSNQPVPLQESLEALRNVQHRGRGGNDA